MRSECSVIVCIGRVVTTQLIQGGFGFLKGKRLFVQSKLLRCLDECWKTYPKGAGPQMQVTQLSEILGPGFVQSDPVVEQNSEVWNVPLVFKFLSPLFKNSMECKWILPVLPQADVEGSQSRILNIVRRRPHREHPSVDRR